MIKVRHILTTGLVLGGCAYSWNLIPAQYRPHVAKSPVHKSEQTITVDVTDPNVRSIGPGNHSFRVACDVPDLLHPVEGKPSSVHILFRYAGTIVGDTTMPCPST